MPKHDYFLPEWSWDWVLELEPAWLSVDLQGHHVHRRVVELDPGKLGYNSNENFGNLKIIL